MLRSVSSEETIASWPFRTSCGSVPTISAAGCVEVIFRTASLSPLRYACRDSSTSRSISGARSIAMRPPSGCATRRVSSRRGGVSTGRPGTVPLVTRLDWIALGVVAISALAGLRRGLVVGLLSMGGFVAGAFVGGRIARHVLAGGTSSPYLPLVALAGALVLAAVLQ